MHRCTKAGNSLDLVLLLITESFPPPTAQDGALSLSSNQPIISNFRNNPVRRAAWGRERNLLCGRSLLSARSFLSRLERGGSGAAGEGGAGLPGVIGPAGAPGTAKLCSGKDPPALQDYPPPTAPTHHLALNFSPSGKAQPPPRSSPSLLILYPVFSPVPEQPRAAAGTAAKHRAGLAGSQ